MSAQSSSTHSSGGYRRAKVSGNMRERMISATTGTEPKTTQMQRRLSTIAIVEDDALVRSSLEQFINQEPGYRCVCACGSAEEALKQIPKVMPDVVLMDIHLPALSGVECARRLKELLPRLHILMLTVYEDSERIFNALEAGASGYLLKRAEPEEILAAVAEVQGGGAPMSSQIARRVVESFRKPVTGNNPDLVLSVREAEVLGLLTKGFSNKEIAAQFHISVPTVCTHLQHIYQKLHVRTRTEAVAKALR